MQKRFIEVSQITIPPNRMRQEFDQKRLQELVESITQFGLFHAPVLRQGGELVAGERRLRAIRDIYELGGQFEYDGELVPQGLIPYVLLSDLDALGLKAAELEENLRRVNLTWQEHAAAVAELDQLRAQQAAEKGEPPPTPADIAEELKGSRSGSVSESVRKEILIARHLDDPDVKAAKDVNEAFKVVKRKEAARRHNELAQAVGESYQTSLHKLHLGDSYEWMKNLPSEQFDVILTDPPYGIGADEFGDAGGKAAGEHFYQDSPEVMQKLLKLLPDQLYRLAKPDAHLYLFCDIDWFPQLKARFAEAGWRVFRTPLTWYKPNAYRAPWPEHGPQRRTEWILYAVKGNKKVTKLGGDLVECPPDDNLGHPAQKPIALLVELLKRSVVPGDRILDPFGGSGSTVVAAHQLMCYATMSEVDSTAYGLAAKRVGELK